jgi:hypothetical protein
LFSDFATISQRFRSDFAAISQRWRKERGEEAIVNDRKTIAKLLQSGSYDSEEIVSDDDKSAKLAAIAGRSQRDYNTNRDTIAKAVRGDFKWYCAAITLRLRDDCDAIDKRLRRDFKSIAGDCKAINRDYEAVTKR